MMLIDSHRQRNISQGIPPIDLSGYGLERDFSFLRSTESRDTVKICAFIVGWSGTTNMGAAFYVFYDGNEPTLNSKIGSDPMTPTTESLGDRYASTGYNFLCKNVFCNITGVNVAMSNNYFMENGVINTLNGRPALRMLGSGSSSGNKIDELDFDVNHTCHAIGSNSNASSNANFMSTVQTYTSAPFSRYQLSIRTDTTKRISILRSNAAITYFSSYINQQNSTTQRRLTSSYESGVELRSYFNASLQEVTPLLSTTEYLNEKLVFGVSPNVGALLTGYWQAFRVRNQKTTDAIETNFDNKLNEYYNF